MSSSLQQDASAARLVLVFAVRQGRYLPPSSDTSMPLLYNCARAYQNISMKRIITALILLTLATQGCTRIIVEYQVRTIIKERSDRVVSYDRGYIAARGEATSALYAQYKKAVEKYEKMAADSGEAAADTFLIITMRSLAEQGLAPAQNELGILYYHGWIVPKDDLQAVTGIKKAAAQDYAPAQTQIGNLYRMGLKGFPQDFSEAIKWYRKAAEQGFAEGQYLLGLMYTHGSGVPKDHFKGMKLYRMAADQGVREARAAVRNAQRRCDLGEQSFCAGL